MNELFGPMSEFEQKIGEALTPQLKSPHGTMFAASILLKMATILYTHLLDDDAIGDIFNNIKDDIPKIRAGFAEMENFNKRTLH